MSLNTADWETNELPDIPALVPSVPTKSEGGNTKTPSSSPALYWCFTLNNYTENDILSLESLPCSKVPTLVFQHEVGESGTPHLQGALKFKKKLRPMSLGLSKRIHWEVMRAKDRKDAFEYCLKGNGDNYQYIRGYERPYGLHISLRGWQRDIIDIINTEPDDRTVHWVYEEEGGAGKTTLGKYIFLNYERVVVLGGKADDMKNCIVQYIEKNDCYPRVIIINIARDSRNISYKGIEEIKDMFFYSGKYEGGMVCGPNPHVFVFANNPPLEGRLSADRWKLIHIS